MVKVGGERKSQKACTKHGHFTKSGRGICQSRGNERFLRNIGGNTKIEGENLKFVGDD